MSNPLEVIRESRGLSKSALATLCGCSRVHIHDLEIRKRQPSLRLFVQLVRALDLSANEALDLAYAMAPLDAPDGSPATAHNLKEAA